MKHFSLLKLIVALCICNAYIFCCAVTGSVGSIATEDTANDNEQTSDETINRGGTVDFIGDNDFINDDHNNSDGDVNGGENTSTVSIENLGFAKPTFVNKTISSSYLPTSSVKVLTQKEDEVSSSSTSSESVPDIVDPYVPPESKPDPPSVPSTSTDTSAPNDVPVESSSSSDSENDDPQSVPSTSTDTSDPNDEPVGSPGDDPNTEIFRVNNNGTEVSGKAVDIITKIVENEIGSTFAPEAIKAQAVTAYTYVKYHNLHGNAPFCVLRESTNDSVRTLVQSVLGQGIYYDGELIQAVYSASSAGSTASSQNVWGGYLPYLQGVYCELDELYDPNYGRKKTFSENEMKQLIYNNANIALSGDPASWFVIENRTEGKYVGDMTIGGQNYFIDNDGDTLKITGRRFREIIMNFNIRSSAFDIDYNANTQEFTITTYGYGHGVGLSQNGANNLAKYWGWDYKKILTFYFQGTEVY